jgi:hypothetical protein
MVGHKHAKASACLSAHYAHCGVCLGYHADTHAHATDNGVCASNSDGRHIQRERIGRITICVALVCQGGEQHHNDGAGFR